MRYEELITEQRNPRTQDIDRASPMTIVSLMLAEETAVAAAVGDAAESIARAIGLAEQRLRRGGRLLYVGAGTSGRLAALDAAECPPTFGTPPELVVAVMAGGNTALASATEEVEDEAEAGAQAMAKLDVGEVDFVLGISASGVTPFVHGAVTAAHEVGAATGMLICNPQPALPRWLDVVIRVVVGPEVIAGSTRLKAGTATKIVLNMVSTGAMIGLGKVYQNLMVDMVPSNNKLRHRALRILQETTGLDEQAACARLTEAGNDLKVAIVMTLAGIAAEEAKRRLAAADGQVRVALGER